MTTRNYLIKSTSNVIFNNNVDECVGTGRMGLALQKEYQEQLSYVQKEIGFKHIRGHGLFADDMAIYHTYKDKTGKECVEYNFTYLDLVMDNYLSLNIKPFLELGFMPKGLSSGEQTVFYWKGNVCPPKDYDNWCDLVKATLQHLLKRYGRSEVITWPIEVWNEPNLPVFWKDADMQEYFKLFEKTFNTIKKIDSEFRVGGPAICGVDDVRWMKSFMEFCHKQAIPLDFVTRHHYTTEQPDGIGHYGYQELSDAKDGFKILHATREIIDSYKEYKGLQIHITEFNTSYIPNCPLHDTNQNAAYVASLLACLGDDNESYSYWTFGDIFEEWGVPFTPFHGGFGMLANGCIPKPTFYTFKFFKELQGTCLLKTDDSILMKRTDNSFCGLIWNSCRKRSNEELTITFDINKDCLNCNNQYTLIQRTVDEDTCNPLKHWHNMGEPSSLSEIQKQILVDSAKPRIDTSIIDISNTSLKLTLSVKENGLNYFELIPRKQTSDRGYDYDRVMQI